MLGAHGGVAGVDEVAHAADFLVGVLVRPPGVRAGVDLDGGIAVTDAGEGDGVIVLGENQVVVRGEVRSELVEDIRVACAAW